MNKITGTEKKLQIGVLGCSRVAKRYFFPYISSSEFADVGFIGSRSLEKAQQYAKDYDVTKYGSYEDVVNSDVDIIYISLPISMHEEWCIKSAKQENMYYVKSRLQHHMNLQKKSYMHVKKTMLEF